MVCHTWDLIAKRINELNDRRRISRKFTMDMHTKLQLLSDFIQLMY